LLAFLEDNLRNAIVDFNQAFHTGLMTEQDILRWPTQAIYELLTVFSPDESGKSAWVFI